MKKILLWTVLLVAPLLGASAVLYSRGLAPRMRSQQPTHQHELIPQPQAWVAFDADIRRVYEKTGEVVVGRVYRASDGSTRSETGRSLDAIDTIGIKNISSRTLYMWQGNDTWTAQPMELPPEGWHPFPRIKNPGVADVADRVEGFELVKIMSGDKAGDRTLYEAPQLNFFPLITEIPCTTTAASRCGVWHSPIMLREQPVELFRPPAGARIIQKSQPGGIVREKAPAR